MRLFACLRHRGMCSPHRHPARVAPDFFSRKRNREKKRRRGELLVPLSTPLQKGGLFMGPPHFLVVIDSLCGYLSCMAVQRFPHRQEAHFKWHQAGAIPPQQKFSPVAHWGSAEGAAPPLRFLSHRFLWQRKRCPRWVSGPRGERKNPPTWLGHSFLFQEWSAAGVPSGFTRPRWRKENFVSEHTTATKMRTKPIINRPVNGSP